ncbi:MAG: hypothetical protein M4D80_30100 [Myxococcota bacterium]|nr:hypothetical protein [Deltaproteobacteria bacterium]MDQ3339439.1 hypothetical protein [Myxococcota bacterium]
MIDITEYEGAAGDVDKDGFGPIIVQHRETAREAVHGIGGVRDRQFQVTELVVADGLSQEDVIALFVLVYLYEFCDDYYRAHADRVSLAYADGTKTVVFNYPPKK